MPAASCPRKKKNVSSSLAAAKETHKDVLPELLVIFTEKKNNKAFLIGTDVYPFTSNWHGQKFG